MNVCIPVGIVRWPSCRPAQQTLEGAFFPDRYFKIVTVVVLPLIRLHVKWKNWLQLRQNRFHASTECYQPALGTDCILCHATSFLSRTYRWFSRDFQVIFRGFTTSILCLHACRRFPMIFSISSIRKKSLRLFSHQLKKFKNYFV